MNNITREELPQFTKRVLQNKQFVNATKQLEQVLQKRWYWIELNVELEKAYLEFHKLDLPPNIK